MSKNLEIESKVLLSENEYNNLINYLSNFKIDSYEQTNFYIDSKNSDIAKNHASLRIRYKKNQYELTFKFNQKIGKMEYNFPLTSDDFNNFFNFRKINNIEIINILTKFNLVPEDLNIITSLKTIRIDASIDSCLVSLDKNEYNNLIDYELEVEASNYNNALQTIKKICELNHIFYQENKKSKQYRAISTINK